nr:immunoglobulin heavy chain junction region [Homo sapiens]
DTAVYYCARG